MSKAIDNQVGGNHYKKKKIQPWHIIDEYQLDFYLGNVLKYILRDKNDNQLEDLKKARHYLDKRIEDYTPIVTIRDEKSFVDMTKIEQDEYAIREWLDDSEFTYLRQDEAGHFLFRNQDLTIFAMSSYSQFFTWLVKNYPDLYLRNGGSMTHVKTVHPNR